MVQEKLINCEKPLHEAYCLVHWFCSSLQLDVLYCQAIQIAKMSANYIRTDQYDPRECRLTLSYWLSKDQRNKMTSQHRIIIYADKNKWHSGLRTKHQPASPELPTLDDGSLSLHRLLNETVLFRCAERLRQAKQLLMESLDSYYKEGEEGKEQKQNGQKKTEKGKRTTQQTQTQPIKEAGHFLLSLSCPLVLVGKCHPDESLSVTVNTFLGKLNCRVQVLGLCDEIRQLEQQLNSSNPSRPAISRLFSRLRIMAVMERLNRALVGLQVRPLSDAQALPFASKLSNLPKDRRIFQFIRDDQFYLIVSFVPHPLTGVQIQFHLFSAPEGQFTVLDLDGEQIIRSAPLPKLYDASVTLKRNWGDFCAQYERRDGDSRERGNQHRQQK